jgi:Zn-dependent peptidase ImmA (M78 family)
MSEEKIKKKIKELLQKNHISKPPVDVEKIAAVENLEIRLAPTGTNISGALVRSGDTTFIAINNAQHSNRQRFTIAHELAHYYLDHPGEDLHVDGDFTVNLRYRSSTDDARDAHEVEANRFAAALLMPQEFLTRDMFADYPLDEEKVKKLARKYQVSEQAMTIRLVGLGFVSPD